MPTRQFVRFPFARRPPINPAVRARYAAGGEVPVGPAAMMPQAPLAPSQPGGPGPEMGTPVMLPGADFPPAGSRGVDLIGDADIAPGASATIITFQIQDNFRLRVAGIGFGADDEVALSFLTWSARLNGDALPGYEQVASAIGSLRNISPVFILVGSSGVFTIQVTSDPSAVLTYRFIARINGWAYNEMQTGGS